MPEEANDPRKVAALLPKQLTAMQRQANTYRVRYVKLARLGTEGSSGNHGNHGSVHELAVMYEAINVLKKRLGIKTIALAGQSLSRCNIASSLLDLCRVRLGGKLKAATARDGSEGQDIGKYL